MKIFIKYLPLFLFYGLIVTFGLYGTTVRQKNIYEEYNGMKGTVISSVSGGRSPVVICVVQLSNGLTGTVNNGYYNTSAGDLWTNEVYYTPIIGISGVSSFIIPTENRCLLESLIVILFIVIPGIFLFCVIIGKGIYFWIKNMGN